MQTQLLSKLNYNILWGYDCMGQDRILSTFQICPIFNNNNNKTQLRCMEDSSDL